MQASTGGLKWRGIAPGGVGRGRAAMALVTAVLVAGTYLWQLDRLNERQVALDQAVSTGSEARDQASMLESQVAGLESRTAALSRNGDALRARIRQTSGHAQHLSARLRTSEQRLRSAQTRMTALLGSPIADGRYFGEVLVVGANQAPPRLVIDLERWLTGDAAHDAELEYGVPPEGLYDNFIENENPTWHTIVIAPTATVSIIDMDSPNPLQEVGTGLVGTDRISLGRFAKMMDLHRLYNPFWINVSNGRIASIQEQYSE
jgi:hypothetical protein